jgi:hypothetical protein
MKGSLHISVVKVGNKRSSPGARRELIRCSVLSFSPRGIVSRTPRVSFIMFLLLAIELRVRSNTITDSKDVINVNFLNKAVEFV